MNKKLTGKLSVLLLLSLFSLSTLASNIKSSPTNDEFAHLPAGYVYLKTGDFSLYHKNPPLIKMISAIPLLVIEPDIDFNLNWRGNADWIPWIFGKYFMEHNTKDYDSIFFWGRIPILILSLILAIFIYRWSTKLYGQRAGLFSLFLYTLSPNIIAHSSLATTDVGTTLLIFLSLYTFNAFLKSPSHIKLFLSGIILGLAQLSKFTSVFLIFILPIAGFLFLINMNRDKERAFHLHFTKKININGLKGLTISLFIMFITALIILNAGYGFKGSFKPIGEYGFESNTLNALKETLPAGIPIPFPYDYVSGFDDQKNDTEVGEFPNFFMGEWSNKGWWYYLPVAFLIKTPIPLTIFIIITIAAYLTRRWKPSLDEILLVVPIVVMLFFFIFFSRLNIGIRYLLPFFPFIFVLLSRIATINIDRRHNKLIYLLLFLPLWYGSSSLAVAPHYISYFNEFVGGPKNGYKYLIDSNIDWGQDLKGLKSYMDNNGIDHIKLAYFGSVDPNIYDISYEIPKRHPEKGLHAVSVNYLQGLPYPIIYGERMMDISKGHFSWIKEYKSVGNIGGSIFIFNINSL